MITVKEIDGIITISSAVTSFTDCIGYCEYKIPIILKGIKAPPSEATIQGSASHQEEEDYEKEHVEFEEVTPEQLTEQLADTKKDVEFPREEIFTRLRIPLTISDKPVTVSLFGRTDKIFRNDEILTIQDDKFPQNPQRYTRMKEPYLNQQLQTLTYLNSLFSHKEYSGSDDWFEIPHKKKEWIIQIKDSNNKSYKTFQGVQTEESLAFLHYHIERFASLVTGAESPNHHNMPNKCKACSYYDVCDERIEA